MWSVGFSMALLLGAVPPGMAVGPRVHSQPQGTETPGPIVVTPELSGLPEALIDLRESLARPPLQGWYGIGLTCSDCSIGRDDSVTVWSFGKPPEIHYVDPDGPAGKAGLRRGDVLIQIDGIPITSREGGRRFGATKPGDTVRWMYVRNGKKQAVSLVAAAHPNRITLPLDVSADVETALAELRREQANLLEEGKERTAELETLRSAGLEEQIRAALAAFERASEAMRRQGYSVSPGGKGSEALIVPSRRQNLRYEGTLGGSQIEVLGSGSVVVTESHDEGELLITTPDATIRIRKAR